MKKILVIIFLLFSLVAISQERFYNLYEGWIIEKVDLYENNFLTYGLENNPSTLGYFLQFNLIDYTGLPIDSFFYFNNLPVSVNRSKAYLRKMETLYIAAVYVNDNKSHTLEPLLIKYNIDQRSIIDTINYVSSTGVGSTCFFIDTTASGFILSCDYTYNANTFFPLLIFTNHSGEMLFTKQYNFFPEATFNKHVIPYQLLKLPEGGYILSCREDIDMFPTDAQKINAWYIGLDNEGNELWRKRPVTNDDTLTYNPFVFNMPEGDPMIIWTDPYLYNHPHPYHIPFINENGTFWTARINTENGTIYDKRNLVVDLEGFEPKPMWINDYYQDERGNIYLTGEYNLSRKGFLLKIGTDGNAVWMREYECFPENNVNPQYTKLYGLTPTADGGFIMGGEFRATSGGALFPTGIQRGLVIKVDECGCLDEECFADCYVEVSKQYINANMMEIYPNPAKDHIVCTVKPEVRKASVEVYDITGSLVIAKEFNSVNIPEIRLDISSLSGGIYTVNIWADGELYNGKFVK